MRTIAQILDQLRKLDGENATAYASAQAIDARFDTDMSKLTVSVRATSEDRAKAVSDLRKPALARIAELARKAGANAAIAAGLRARVENKEALLADMPFAGSPADDAVIRAQRLAEYSTMSARTLQSIADSAVADGDLPSLWLAYTVGAQRRGEAGWRGVDLSTIVVPGMQAALDLLDKIAAVPGAIQRLYGTVSGSAPRKGSTAALASAYVERAAKPKPITKLDPGLPVKWPRAS